jgi:hypothetical protein
MQLPELFAALEPVLAALADLGMPHYIGGSVASSAHGVVRATADVDIVADMPPEQVNPLAEKLEDQYYLNRETMAEAARRQSCFNLIHLATMLKVDVFVAKRRRHDHEAFRRVQHKAMDADNPERRFPVAAPEDIILAKLEWYRLGNEVSENQWRDVAGLIALHRNTLDRQYLETGARELGVADLLERVWKEPTVD